MMPTKNLSRGTLARRTGINSETIIYFERSGLLQAPPRTAGGHRVYDETHVKTLEFVKRARGLGFSPGDVRTILGLSDAEETPCGKVRDIAREHLHHVRQKIADLRQIERLLDETIIHCSQKSEKDCAVLDLLEGKPSSA